jgi:hypothetical protein
MSAASAEVLKIYSATPAPANPRDNLRIDAPRRGPRPTGDLPVADAAHGSKPAPANDLAGAASHLPMMLQALSPRRSTGGACSAAPPRHSGTAWRT